MRSFPGIGGAALEASSMVSSVCGRHSREEVREGQEAPPGRLLAQHLDQLEERGRRENAGEGETGGLREVSELEAFLGRERASGLLERRVGEGLGGRQALGEDADERRRIRLAELFHAARVEVRRVVAVNREACASSASVRARERCRAIAKARSSGSRSGTRNGFSISMSRAAGTSWRYCPFSQASFSWSKREGEGPMRSSEKSETISARVIRSRSSPR